MITLLLQSSGFPAWSMVSFIIGLAFFIVGWIWGVRAEPANVWPGRWSDLGFFLVVLSIALKVVCQI